MSSNTRQARSTSPEMRSVTNSNFVNVILLIVFIRMPFPPTVSIVLFVNRFRLPDAPLAYLQWHAVIGFSLQVLGDGVNEKNNRFFHN